MNQILNLKKQIEKYIPYNEQEKSDKEIMLKSLETFDDMLTIVELIKLYKEQHVCFISCIEILLKIVNEDEII